MSNYSRYTKDAKVGPILGRHYTKEIPVKNYTAFKVDMGFENRLDLISYKFYGTSKLWWAIAQFNDIKDPFDIPIGLVLYIPSRESLYGFKGVLL